VNFTVVAVNNFGDTRAGGLAGPMGLFIIVLMSIAVVLLIRNMNKRLRRLPDSFPDPVDAKREAEIARLDADLTRPDTATERRPVDADRSDLSAGSADSEVSDVDPIDRPARGSADQAGA
jgi:hypothetical protein